MFKFARRSDWDLSENPLSVELDRLKKAGETVYDLTESNPTRAGFYYPPETFLKSFETPENLIYAPHPKGLLRTREAVSRYYAQKGYDVPPERLTLTSSTSEAYSFLFRLLFEPGDRVLIPAPSYPLFSYLAGLNDVEVDYYFLAFDEGEWRMDIASLESAVTPQTKAVILVSPNNPTGSCLKNHELQTLNEICLRRGMAIISDEVFSDYLFEKNETMCESVAGNAIVPSFALGGLSKALAMPQMKLSWIAANGPKDYLVECLSRLEVIADTYLSVNTPVQNASVEWLSKRAVICDQVLKRVKDNFEVLKRACEKEGRISLLPVEGGWYGIIKAELSIPEDEWAIQLLREKHTYVHPGFYFDFDEEGYIVLCLLTPPQTFREGLSRIFSAL